MLCKSHNNFQELLHILKVHTKYARKGQTKCVQLLLVAAAVEVEAVTRSSSSNIKCRPKLK